MNVSACKILTDVESKIRLELLKEKKEETIVKYKSSIVIFVVCLLTACGDNNSKAENSVNNWNQSETEHTSVDDQFVSSNTEELTITTDTEELSPEDEKLINEDGMTLESRISVPSGYQRTEVEEGSLGDFLHQYPMKAYGSKVHLFDGSEKYNQSAHISVFDLPIENYDLQQCADSVIRMYAEYFWNTKQYDRIAFHYTSGFLAEYPKWREGNRIKVDGNTVKWVKSAGYDDSYECFVEYLKNVFSYAGTLSMYCEEAVEIPLGEAKAGDVFLYGGSPGHVVMIVDVCENEDGEKAFLLAQGYMPAQEFHLLVNENHLEDPWYYESEISYPFSTPEYTFQEGSLKTLLY